MRFCELFFAGPIRQVLLQATFVPTLARIKLRLSSSSRLYFARRFRCSVGIPAEADVNSPRRFFLFKTNFTSCSIQLACWIGMVGAAWRRMPTDVIISTITVWPQPLTALKEKPDSTQLNLSWPESAFLKPSLPTVPLLSCSGSTQSTDTTYTCSWGINTSSKKKDLAFIVLITALSEEESE